MYIFFILKIDLTQISCISGFMKLTTKSITAIALFQCSAAVVSAAPDFSLSIHGNMSAGFSDEGHEHTAIHGHDPNDDFTLQGVELGLSMRANEYLEGFIGANVYLTDEDEVDGEWEEGFLKFKNLPLGTEIRGGRYLNRLGTENNVHLHGWDFATASLSTGVFLGEDGLRTDGAELSWMRDYSAGEVSISGSYGKAVVHEHDDAGHGGHALEEESQELAYINGDLLSVRSQVTYGNTDFVQHRLGLGFAQGENGYGRDTELVGADYTFTWRENGVEKGGRAVSAGVEYFYRNVEWHDEVDPSITGDSSQHSIALKTSYAWNENWKLAARYEWMDAVSGSSFSLYDRERTSLALTHTRQLGDEWSTQARLQYNHDKVADESSNNLYLQLGFSFGGGEVR